MKTSLPQGAVFQEYLDGAHDGAKRDVTLVDYERARLAHIASKMRYPGYVADWPLETPFGCVSPLDSRLQSLRAFDWHGLVGENDQPYQQLIDELQGTAAHALAWFDEFRFPPLAIDSRTGWQVWPVGVGRRRLPAGVHREAYRLAGELSLPWYWRIIDNTPDVEVLGAQRGDLGPLLQFRHLVAVASLMLLREAADVVAAESARLQVEFHRLAPGTRIAAGWRNEAWREASQRLAADERNRLKAMAALRSARQLHERALGWLSAWHRAAAAADDARESAEIAAQAQAEAARRARQEAATRGAKEWADEAREATRNKIAAAYARLLPDQRGRFAAGVIAKLLGMDPRTVRGYLRESNLTGSDSNGR